MARQLAATASLASHTVRTLATSAAAYSFEPTVGRLTAVSISTPDMESHLGFCTEGLGMKPLVNSALARPPRRRSFGHEEGCECVVTATVDAAAAAPPSAALLYPYMTVGVSNLKTAARKAKRWQGNVVGELQPAHAADPTTGAAAQPASAVFVDPAGNASRVLHLFRRNPIVSVTLGVHGLETAVGFFTAALGMRHVSEAELPSLCLPPSSTERVALAFGPVAFTTSLVLERALPSVAGTSTCTDNGVLTLAVERARLGPARAAVRADAEAAKVAWTGWTDLGSGDDKGFLCEAVEGFVLRVVPV